MAESRATTGAPARVGRAVVFAVASVCLALAAHTVGGGGNPPLVLVVTTVGLFALLSYILANRERSLTAITVGLGTGQLVLHVAFALAAPGLAAIATPAPVAHGGMDSGGHRHAAHVDYAAHVDDVDHVVAMVPTLPMALAHVLAAAVTVVAFRQAERTLWAAVALRSWLTAARATAFIRIARVLAALWTATAPPPPLSRPIVIHPGTASRTDIMIGRTSRRRGPPGGVGTSSNAVPAVLPPCVSPA